MYDFLILGGDERMYCLFEMLRKNYTSKMDMWKEKAEKNEVFEDIKNSKNIILPIPSTRDKKTLNAPKSSLSIDICDIQNALCDGQRLFYGLTSKSENLITHKNSYNLLKDKRYTLQNFRFL